VVRNETDRHATNGHLIHAVTAPDPSAHLSPPDPAAARTPQEFVAALNDLRLWAGNPSLRRLRQLGGRIPTTAGDMVDALPAATTSRLLRGGSLPGLPRMTFVRAYVMACCKFCVQPPEFAERQVATWLAAWRRLAASAPTRQRITPRSPGDQSDQSDQSDRHDRRQQGAGDAEGDHGGPYVPVALPVPAPPSDAVPVQLPLDTGGFAGRIGELDRLDAILAEWSNRPATMITVLSGTAGVGKTALVVHWAHRVAGRFPDGQLFVNLRGVDPGEAPVTPTDAVRGVLEALGVSRRRMPAGLDAKAALLRSTLAGKRILMVLDNARDAEQVRPLLPGTPTCLVVVTSRNQLSSLVAVEGARPLTLDPLPADEARQLLTRRLGRARMAAEPEAAQAIIDRCAGLPLALAIVAARAITSPRTSLATLAAALGDARAGLDVFAGAGPDPATDIRAVFSWSLRTLDAPAARLFRLLGLHPGPDFAAPSAASLAGIGVDRARLLLAELARARLLCEHASGRYALHDLLRAYAAELVLAQDADADRRAALRRVLDYYLHTAYNANRLLYPHRDPITPIRAQPGVAPGEPVDHGGALAWFAAERSVLLDSIRAASANGFDAHAWQLAWTLTDFDDWRGHWHDLITAYHVALEADDGAGESRAGVRGHRGAAPADGPAERCDGYDDARTYFRRVLTMYDGLDVAGLDGAGLNGVVLDDAGLDGAGLDGAGLDGDGYEHAPGRDGRGLQPSHASDHRAQVQSLDAFGWDHARLDTPAQGRAHGPPALRLLRELGHRQADAWDSLGYAHHHLGQYASAIPCYRRAIELSRAGGDRYHEADTLTHLGDSHHAMGDDEAARTAWRQALRIFNELDHSDAHYVRARLRET
jgi:tetratricopeptide (TPR) repeat protein